MSDGDVCDRFPDVFNAFERQRDERDYDGPDRNDEDEFTEGKDE
jgi:hypothetical protein